MNALLIVLALSWFTTVILWGRECLTSQAERAQKNQNADDLDDALEKLATVTTRAATYDALKTHHRDSLIIAMQALNLALDERPEHAIALMQEHAQ
jgi:hypothetical protein